MRRLCVALALMLFGCDGPGRAGLQCEMNSDCQSPLVCRLTRCRRECRSARDCPLGAICVRDDQGIGACQLLEEDTCALNSDCAAPLVCRSGTCTEECVEDRDCLPGARCEGDEGMRGCVASGGTTCLSSSDCDAAAGLRCALDGICRPPCLADRDCAFGEACVDGDCAVLGGMDAGADASVADAGPGDAGAGDAGLGCSGAAECMTENVMNADCVAGACVIMGCAPDFGDCDGSAANGCEESLADNIDHCGQCDASCGFLGECSQDPRIVPDMPWRCSERSGVALGAAHMCVSRRSREGTGTVCLGSNDFGELSTGMTSADVADFALVEAAATRDVLRIAAGAALTCLQAGANWSCAGADGLGQTGNGSSFTTFVTPASSQVGFSPVGTFNIDLGGSYASATPPRAVATGAGCGVDTGNDRVYCWGQADMQGTGTTMNAERVMTEVTGVLAVDVSVGATHVCAAGTGGLVFCWGGFGTWLGQGATGPGPALLPVMVPGITDAVAVAAGDTHTCAVRSGGEVWCWGDGPEGQLGNGSSMSTSTPLQVAGISDATDVEASGTHTCVLRMGGRVSCWGANDEGQLGDGTTTGGASVVDVAGVANAVQLTIANGRNCVMRDDDAILCWGGTGRDYGSVDTAAWTTGTPHPLFPPIINPLGFP